LLLLGPATPMLFQGQEFASSSPFLFFADHSDELARAVRKGRAEFLAQFPSLATPEMQRLVPDSADRATFEKCKLDVNEREAHVEAYTLHGDLLRLRRRDPVFSKPRAGSLDGAILASEAFLIRWFDDEKGDRLLIVNLGADLHLSIAPEPLLAPPERRRWDILWSSESPKYGGAGTAALETEDGWHIPGHAAVLLVPEPENTNPDD
jgi:maltooligosyltrehalose trehalohydrolase